MNPLYTLEKGKPQEHGGESFSSLNHDQLRDLHPDFVKRPGLAQMRGSST